MRAHQFVAGAIVGAVLGLGAVVAIDTATEGAEAQGGGVASKADVDTANERSIRAIKQGTKAWNLVAKYLAEPDERVAVKSPRVSQEKGVGGGIPEEALSAPVRAKLNASGAGAASGPIGPQGPQGTPGPTSGDSDSPNSPPIDESQLAQWPVPGSEIPTLETSEPGRLYLSVNGAISGTCNDAASLPFAVILLDGEAVPGSFRPLPEGGATRFPFTATGVTDDVVPSGDHIVQIGLGCNPDPFGAFDPSNDMSASAIVLGG